jgi:hypothetical protein
LFHESDLFAGKILFTWKYTFSQVVICKYHKIAKLHPQDIPPDTQSDKEAFGQLCPVQVAKSGKS